jgi:hypothetical protein
MTGHYERHAAYQILAGWIRLEHAGARRREAVSFRAADDMQDLWTWILREGLA